MEKYYVELMQMQERLQEIVAESGIQAIEVSSCNSLWFFGTDQETNFRLGNTQIWYTLKKEAV